MAVKREQVVQTAEKYVSRGKIEAAIKEYKKLLAENPNDINTLNRVGDLYARIQRIDEAVDFFNQIAAQYTAEGFFPKATAIYKKIIKLDPTRLEIYEKLAELYGRQGLVTEARGQYQVLADYYQKHENAASAIAIYQKMAALEPENPTYHVKLAEIYQAQRLNEKALGEYRIIAEMMVAAGHPQEAAQVYERALDLDATNISFVTDAVLKLREAGQAAAAAHLLSVAVEHNPQAERVARLVGLGEQPHAEPAAQASAAAVETPPSAAGPEAPPEAPDIELPQEFALEPPQAAPPAPAPAAPPARSAAPPIPAAEPEEYELDLDDAFVLDLDDESPPSSLVAPPPDVLETSRPAWSHAAEVVQPAAPSPPAAPPQAAAPAEAEALEDSVLDFDLGVLEELEPPPAPPASAAGAPAAPELDEEDLGAIDAFELELEPLPELEELAPLPDIPVPTPPAEPPAGARLELNHVVLERAADEVAPPRPKERDEDLVTEAEVLAKYGLEEKAFERLRQALRLNPRHLEAHAVLVHLHLEKGRHAKVAELAQEMAKVAARARNDEPWQRVRRRLLGAGFTVEEDRVVAPPPRAAARDKEIEKLLKGLLEVPAAKAKKGKPAPPAIPAAPPPQAAAPPPAPPQVAPPSLRRTGKIDLRGLGQEIAAEEFGDIEEMLDATPGSVPLVPPEDLLPAHLDDTGMSWLEEADNRKRIGGIPSERLFAAEEEFFDLAGELEEELSREGLATGELLIQPREQSLEEIVEGFKKGVAENLSPTDYETHFNLGIAYREMGLLDEAIGEFQLAAKSQAHLVSCCSMLGLCFLDKRLPELAVKWYRRGLHTPGVGEEDAAGLLYDLGNVQMELGENDAAYRTFVELYGINTNYRDVVAKLEELGPSRSS
ncbi:MAG TPA: tetratricopeptide repeat protein [Thermoanaerobaculia bacterium]|nr:tetratricopeptide repeat protein [Thermoanaerobaculia bacterium]